MCNSGDEGSSFQTSYTVFHWQCDLAPFLADSKSSRYVITTIPSTAYIFDGDVNVTLQCAAGHIRKSFNGLKLTIPCLGGEPDSWIFMFFFTKKTFEYPNSASGSPLSCTMAAWNGPRCQCMCLYWPWKATGNIWNSSSISNGTMGPKRLGVGEKFGVEKTCLLNYGTQWYIRFWKSRFVGVAWLQRALLTWTTATPTSVRMLLGEPVNIRLFLGPFNLNWRRWKALMWKWFSWICYTSGILDVDVTWWEAAWRFWSWKNSLVALWLIAWLRHLCLWGSMLKDINWKCLWSASRCRTSTSRAMSTPRCIARAIWLMSYYAGYSGRLKNSQMRKSHNLWGRLFGAPTPCWVFGETATTSWVWTSSRTFKLWASSSFERTCSWRALRWKLVKGCGGRGQNFTFCTMLCLNRGLAVATSIFMRRGWTKMLWRTWWSSKRRPTSFRPQIGPSKDGCWA